MNLEDLKRHIIDGIEEANNKVVPEFEGYSPFEMHQILHFTFGEGSPIKLQELSDNNYKKIPILNQTKYLTDLIGKTGEIKLTKKGFLPTKIVSDIYQHGYIKEESIESGISKLYKETDSMAINLTKILLELAGLTKKRNGKLSLTKTGEKTISSNFNLLKIILETFTTKFNWAYYDGYGENRIGQLGFGFSMILLSKYGGEKRPDSFYAERYFKAFPTLLNEIEPDYGTLEYYTSKCYSLRTFDRFLNYFGLIKIEEENIGFQSNKNIKKTDLLDKLIKCIPHTTQ